MDTTQAASGALTDTTRKRALSKVTWRLMPFIFTLYLVNYLDRTALGIANVNGLSDELALTATMFGLASGIFFVGYIILEVPSSVITQKIGARTWIARIAVTWGIVASLTAFVPSYEWLLFARFMLGVAEAGFAPAVLLYLTLWFSNKDRPKAFSLYLLGIPLSSMLAGPLASWLIVAGDGVFGLTGWRFMTLVTGLPAIVLGFVAYFYLTDRPSEAKWLTEEEKSAIQEEIDRHETAESRNHVGGILSALKSGRVWVMGVAYMCVVYGLYAIGFFAPSIISGFAEQFGTTFTILERGLLLAIPYAFAAVALVLWPRHAARGNDLGWHIVIGTAIGASGIVIAAVGNSPFIVMLGVTLCAVGVISSMPLVYSLPARILPAATVGTGLALVNTIGNVGGFAGPFFTGWMRDLSGSTVLPFAILAVILLSAGVISVVVQRDMQRRNHELADTSDDGAIGSSA